MLLDSGDYEYNNDNAGNNCGTAADNDHNDDPSNARRVLDLARADAFCGLTVVPQSRDRRFLKAGLFPFGRVRALCFFFGLANDRRDSLKLFAFL